MQSHISAVWKIFIKLIPEAQPVFYFENLINVLEWHFICIIMTFGIRIKEAEKEIYKSSLRCLKTKLASDAHKSHLNYKQLRGNSNEQYKDETHWTLNAQTYNWF